MVNHKPESHLEMIVACYALLSISALFSCLMISTIYVLPSAKNQFTHLYEFMREDLELKYHNLYDTRHINIAME